MKNPKLMYSTNAGDKPTVFFQNLKAARLPGSSREEVLADPRVVEIQYQPDMEGYRYLIWLSPGLRAEDRTSSLYGDTLAEAVRGLRKVEVGEVE